MCIRDRASSALGAGQAIGLDGPERFALLYFRADQPAEDSPIRLRPRGVGFVPMRDYTRLLYTSDAADERPSVNLGGRRIINKKH